MINLDREVLGGWCGLGRVAAWHDNPSRPVVEIAISPDVVWLAARSLGTHNASYPTAVDPSWLTLLRRSAGPAWDTLPGVVE